MISPESGKLLAILAYLATIPGRRATRERLADFFWADSTGAKARNALRQALYKLRTVLGDELCTSSGTSDIVLSVAVTTDREAFLAALDTGDLDGALLRYTGPFAPGFVSAGSADFEHWADGERERLHQHFAGAVETAAQRLIAAGDPRAARALAQRLLDIDPLNEKAWRLRLDAELAAGSRVHILATVAELQRRLAQENRQPGPRTRQLIDRLTHTTDPAVGDNGKATLVADLVGRETEFGRLYQGWRSATARNAAHLPLTAPAGVGKTRLLNDFAFRLEAERARIARVRATPRQRTVTGSVLATLVSALADLSGATGIADRSAQILVDLQPAIAARFPNASPLAATDSDERRRMRTDALVDLLGALAEDGPVCLLLDDMHWWDSYSRDVVADAIERVAGKAILIVTASRPGTGEVATSTSSSTITLHALDRDQITALLTSLGDATDPKGIGRLADGLLRATDGVPLLVIEAVRLGLDRGELGLEQSHWDFSHLDQYLASLRPGVVLAERIAALTPAQRDLLLLASVIEQPVNDRAAIAGRIEVPAATLLELERLGMLAPQGNGWIAAHDVIAQITMETATPEAVRHAHGVAGSFLAAAAETQAQFAEAVQHFLDAGDTALLAVACSEWVRRRRASGDTRSGAAIARELLDSPASDTTIAAIIRLLPPHLRHRPWRTRLLWPAVAAAGVLMIGAAWWASTASQEPDSTVGLFVGAPERAVQLAVPLHANHWDLIRGDLPTIPASKSPARFPGRPLNFNGVPMVAPDGRRWLVSRTVTGDFGPTELYLTDAAGMERPIAPARGDDVAPDWSPDGTQAVFATTRWSPSGDASFDLGVLDVANGVVRRLTSDQASHELPHWSPDGTRIAFVRKPFALAPDELCWISPDGARQHCRSVVQGIIAVIGWLDQRTVLTTLRAGRDEMLASVAIDGTDITPILTGQIGYSRLSANAEWLLCNCGAPETPNATAQLMVFPTRRPEANRRILGVAPSAWFWDAGPQRAWLAQLRIVNPSDSMALDASYRMSVTGVASDGSRLGPADAVLIWHSSDSSVARIDSFTGDLHPYRRGATWISVSAGGWRRDSLRIFIGGPAATTALREDWTPSWQDRWELFGPDPQPGVVASQEVGRGFTPNGNGTYADGAYTRQDFPAGAGIGVEAIVQAPITRGKWQMIDLGIRRIDRIAAAGPVGNGCGARYPAGEGWSGLHLLGAPDGSVRVSDQFATGKPFRLRIQIFPDGTCGVAVDGQPVGRHASAMPTDQPLAIVVMGQSVQTHMLIGPLTAWRGVRGDVDWSALGRDTTKAVSGPNPWHRSARP